MALWQRSNTAVPIQAQFEHNNYINEDQARKSGQPGREITEQALAFLDKRDAQRPFFMYLGYETPHDPRVPTTEDAATTRGNRFRCRKTFCLSIRSTTAR